VREPIAAGQQAFPSRPLCSSHHRRCRQQGEPNLAHGPVWPKRVHVRFTPLTLQRRLLAHLKGKAARPPPIGPGRVTARSSSRPSLGDILYNTPPLPLKRAGGRRSRDVATSKKADPRPPAALGMQRFIRSYCPVLSSVCRRDPRRSREERGRRLNADARLRHVLDRYFAAKACLFLSAAEIARGVQGAAWVLKRDAMAPHTSQPMAPAACVLFQGCPWWRPPLRRRSIC